MRTFVLVNTCTGQDGSFYVTFKKEAVRTSRRTQSVSIITPNQFTITQTYVAVYNKLEGAHQHAVWAQQFALRVMSLQTVQYSTATVLCGVIEHLGSEIPHNKQPFSSSPPITESETVHSYNPPPVGPNFKFNIHRFVHRNIGCPTRYQTRHFFNNSNTNEDIATKFEQQYVLFFHISYTMRQVRFKFR